MSAPWWYAHALCRSADPELFFGIDGERGSRTAQRVKEAKAVCGQCTVRAECLEYALGKPEKTGVWGGLSEDERADERGERKKQRRRVRRGDGEQVAS